MRDNRLIPPGLALSLWLLAAVRGPAPEAATVFPGATWETRAPAEVGLDAAELDAIRDYLQGRGAIVRNGFLVYTWGDPAGRGDVASAAKPLYTHFLFTAVERGLLADVLRPVSDYEPCVAGLNPSLQFKDRAITFRDLANQIACYGVSEPPGGAFDYSDWQMALFWDTLFLKVWNTTYDRVDADVLAPYLSGILQFEDNPTFMAFGTEDRPGRVAISPRDHCRFGLLYLNRGNWNGVQVISEEHAATAVGGPVPLWVPRTSAVQVEMCPGQRSIGSTDLPDDQTDHDGGYSWLWWVNGIDREGARKWSDAESNVFAALGHENGKRGMAVVPCLGVVIAWNDTALDSLPAVPHPLNEVFRLLHEAAGCPIGGPGTCAPENPPAEACNGMDDNCDGRIDEEGDALCDDHDVCNGPEHCGGTTGCEPGAHATAWLNCDDGVPCTLDTCDPAMGCVHTPTVTAPGCKPDRTKIPRTFLPRARPLKR